MPKPIKKTKPSIVDWDKQFDKVSRYAKVEFGYDVYVLSDAEYGKIDFDKKEIIIKAIYNNKENMTYLLLHELGHIIQSKKTKLYKRRITEVIEVVSKSSLSFRTTMLYEEMDAWNEAYDFAKKIRIPLDRKKFETYKSRCLKTYMVWAITTNQKQPQVSINQNLIPTSTTTTDIVDELEIKNIENTRIHYDIFDQVSKEEERLTSNETTKTTNNNQTN